MTHLESRAAEVAAEIRRVLRTNGLPDDGIAAVGRAMIGLSLTGSPRVVVLGKAMMVLPPARRAA